MNKLREYRKKAHMNAACLADKVGVSVRHLQFIESGKRMPSLSVAKRIADCLDNTIENIFYNNSGDSNKT